MNEQSVLPANQRGNEKIGDGSSGMIRILETSVPYGHSPSKSTSLTFNTSPQVFVTYL